MGDSSTHSIPARSCNQQKRSDMRETKSRESSDHLAPALVVQDAVKTFPLRRRRLRRARMTALDKVSLTVERGETVGLVGESGSGKSTLARCILKLISLDEGTIVFQGREIQNLEEREFRPQRRRLQMVFQDPGGSFSPMMTIGQTLFDAMRSAQEWDKREKQNRLLALLDQVELGERFATLYPNEMSGGQLQRAALARALAPGPELVFLDEPTAALDMSTKGQIINLLHDLQRQNHLSFIYVSHDLHVVQHVADRVYVMYLGQIVESGTRGQIFETPRHPYTKAILAATSVGQPLPKKEADESLRGEVIQRENYVGCKLYDRCPYAEKRCAEEPQILRELESEHWVRCRRAEEIADRPAAAQPEAKK